LDRLVLSDNGGGFTPESRALIQSRGWEGIGRNPAKL
jgi:hypothetical protein